MDRRHFMRASGAVALGAVPLGEPYVRWAGEPGAPRSSPGSALPSEPLLRAVREGRIADVRRLLDHDATLRTARDLEGRSAYVLAHLHGHADIAAELLSRGLELDLVEAVLARDWERFESLASVAPGAVNLDHPIGGTTMYAAAWSGLGADMWRVQQFDGDANANPRGADGFTPVRVSIEHPDRYTMHDTLATLVGNGGDANAPQRGGDSPLHAVARLGDVTMVRHLLRKGADASAVDDEGRRPIDVARAAGHSRVVDVLARPDAVPRDHRTSRFAYHADGTVYSPPEMDIFDNRLRNRMVGAAHFDVETVRALHGRAPQLVHSVSYADEGAVEACAHTGQRPVVAFLLERGAPYSLPTAVMMGDHSTARRLLAEDRARVYERGAHDFALTWYAAIGGDQVELMELLLESGAPVDQDYLGTTVLHWAARGGHNGLTRLLIDAGADINAVGRKFTRDGETPLQHAIAREHAETERLLRAAGARQR